MDLVHATNTNTDCLKQTAALASSQHRLESALHSTQAIFPPLSLASWSYSHTITVELEVVYGGCLLFEINSAKYKSAYPKGGYRMHGFPTCKAPGPAVGKLAQPYNKIGGRIQRPH